MDLDTKIVQKRLATLNQGTLDINCFHDEVDIYRIYAEIEMEAASLKTVESMNDVSEEKNGKFKRRFSNDRYSETAGSDKRTFAF